MKIKIIWPGKTRNEAIRSVQEFYLERIGHLVNCEVVEIKEARGISERYEKKIKSFEAEGFEKKSKDSYIICLSHRGKDMSSTEFAQHLKKVASYTSRPITFIVGGFLGLHEKILKKADLNLALSPMTFSHELIRVILLEQIYRALSILKGMHYAK
jgi:23S rRNA (pseudouridine1915-N3)-methyltransferase